MRIGIMLYWCVFALHLCAADDGERTESREGGRRQWGPVVRSGSFISDSASAASHEISKYLTICQLIGMTPVGVLYSLI